MTGTALQADSLDSLDDAGVYALSLFVVGRSLQWRAGAAVIKGAIQGLFGLAVLAEVARKALLGAAPDAPIMAVVAAIAFVALLFLHTSFAVLRTAIRQFRQPAQAAAQSCQTQEARP